MCKFTLITFVWYYILAMLVFLNKYKTLSVFFLFQCHAALIYKLKLTDYHKTDHQDL